MRVYPMVLAAMAASVSAEMTLLHKPQVVPQGWVASDEVPSPTTLFKVNVGLKRRNVEEMAALLDDVSNPQSDLYLNYPTYEELGELVRPDAAHTAVVKKWLSDSGVAMTWEHPHGDYITAVATLDLLEKMTEGRFTTYTHPASGSKIARMTSGVRVPADVAAAIDTFSGFNGFPLNPAARVRSAASTVTPPFFRTTYNVTSVPKSGHANIQAIAEFQGQFVRDKDLQTFCTQYDNGATCAISKYIGENKQRPGVESMLDTEYMMSLSNTATTWVYSYPNIDFCNDLTQFSANVTGSTTYPFVISVSYGSQSIDYCNAQITKRFSEDVQKMGTMGITMMIASGDDGSGGETRQGSNHGKLSPSFPASSPYATAVGATFFVSGSSGEEEATTQFGSGGGFSYDYPVPSYQAQMVSTYMNNVKKPNAQYATGRGSPDVATLGEDFTVVDYGASIGVGGTSCSSPSFAALVTLLNEVCLAASGKTLGFANPLFYQNPSMFTDVTKGTNAIGENAKAGWEAIAGWDAATGLGTPKFGAMRSVVQQACSKARKL